MYVEIMGGFALVVFIGGLVFLWVILGKSENTPPLTKSQKKALQRWKRRVNTP